MNTDISYAAIDTDILNFMKYVCFGDIANPYETASNNAYRDMCRTLRFQGFPEEDRLKLRWEFRHWLKAAQQQSRKI